MIEKMKKECNCILYLNYFPKKFIFQVEKKRNKHFLDYTFEQLLENKDLYENKDIRNYYTINKKVIDELKSEKIFFFFFFLNIFQLNNFNLINLINNYFLNLTIFDFN